MKRQNIILLTVDELRPDHLSCYGYDKIRTPNIDALAREGVLFETCISTSVLTPICHASVLTGIYPDRHGLRTPFSTLKGTTLAEILKPLGFVTAGFVGVGLMSKKYGFGKGFDFYEEPDSSTALVSVPWFGITIHEGNWWIDRLLSWLKENREQNFFLFAHFFETHEGTEDVLLERGWIKKDYLPEPENSYVDPKIQLYDERVFKAIIDALRTFGIYDDTTIIVTSDHGTNLGEHPAPQLTFRADTKGLFTYPQHRDMYDPSLKVALILKGKGLPHGARVKGVVRHVDVVHTLLKLHGITCDTEFDGVDLFPAVEKGRAEGLTAYAEQLYEKRKAAQQAVRTDQHKFIRDLTGGTEELYDIEKDPGEKVNLIGEASSSEVSNTLRGTCNKHLLPSEQYLTAPEGEIFTEKERRTVEARLKSLGYIE